MPSSAEKQQTASRFGAFDGREALPHVDGTLGTEEAGERPRYATQDRNGSHARQGRHLRGGHAIRDAERLARDQTDALPIDVEWFRVMRAKARGCLQVLNAGDMEEFHALIQHIKAAKEAPLWPSMARALGLRPTEDWFTDEAGPEPNSSGGERQILIHCDELAKGWVYVHAEAPPTDPSHLPHVLNDAFCRWLKQNPNATVRAALPIVAGGNTVAIHVFLD